MEALASKYRIAKRSDDCPRNVPRGHQISPSPRLASNQPIALFWLPRRLKVDPTLNIRDKTNHLLRLPYPSMRRNQAQPQGVWIILVLLAPSNAVGAMVALWASLTCGERSRTLFPLLLSASLILASANSTKLLDGDLRNYFITSQQIGQMDLQTALLQYSMEPGYYLSNWLFVSLLGFNWQSWVFAFSLVFYLIYLTSVERVCRQFDLKKSAAIGLILLAAFFPLVFAQSAHLVRQYIAGAIAVLGCANYLCGRRALLLFLVAPLFHVSAAFFVLLPLFDSLKSRYRTMTIVSILMGVPIVAAAAIALARSPFASLMPDVIRYGLSRIGQEKFYELDASSVWALLFTVVTLLLCLVVLLKQNVKYGGAQQRQIDIFTCILISLASSVLVFLAFDLSELAVRFVQFLFLSFPVLLAVFLASRKELRRIVLAAGLAMPLILVSYPIAWTFAPVDELVVYPYHYFLFFR